MEWVVFDPEEERGKRFPGLLWSHPANLIEQSDEYPSKSIGARQQKRMRTLIEAEVGDGDPGLVEEALRLSRQVMQGVDTVQDLVSVARKVIEESSKSI